MVFLKCAFTQYSISQNNITVKNYIYEYNTSLNIKPNIGLINEKGSIGILGEVQIRLSRKIAYLITTQISTPVNDRQTEAFYQFSTGPKFYFNPDRFRVYVSTEIGIAKAENSIAPLFSPSIGMEYLIQRGHRVNFDIKPNMYITIAGIAVLPFLNVGLCIETF